MLIFASEIVWRKIHTCIRWWCCGVLAIPHTVGFEDRKRRNEHWARHHQDFANSLTPARYEAMADRFLTELPRPSVRRCIRPYGGGIIRYDLKTGAFGVLSKDGAIRSYFKPIPCCLIPPAYVDKRFCHAYADNISYFQAECGK